MHILDEKRDMIIIGREIRRYRTSKCVENRKWYRYKCNKCGWSEGWIEEGNLKKKQGCSCCRGRKAVLGINTIWDTDRYLVQDYGLDEKFSKTHTIGTEVKGLVLCKDCRCERYIVPSNIIKYKSIGCNCNDGKSYLSKYILSMLIQLNLDFELEVKYRWNRYTNPLTNKESQASIDFIIKKDERLIPLEADGGFHRKNNSMNGITAEMQQYIDKQRDENCLKYLGEETIRISDEGSIRDNILNSKLNKLFVLSKIDWLKCEEFALKNIAKEVCEYWSSKKEWETTKDIQKIFGISRGCVIAYLKKGSKLGWCNYDSKKELKKGRLKGLRKIHIKSKKTVIMHKDNILIGVFESATDLSKKSEELFGIKLNNSNISAVCRGKLTQYKGFVFEYAK